MLSIGTSARARERLVRKLAAQNLATDEVFDVMNRVPRHQFVDPAMAHRAYDDTVLPIGFQQTISQPTVVAMMSSAAAGVANRGRVLEIGTGCGYQTAILACLFEAVFTVERIERLQLRARETLADLDIHNVFYRFADGHEGWCEHAPFDAVIGTAGAERVPDELGAQVAMHGRLVMPVDDPTFNGQALVQWDRTAGGFIRSDLCAVRFVPMLSGVQAAS